MGDRMEVVSGVKAGERVAISDVDAKKAVPFCSEPVKARSRANSESGRSPILL